MLTCEPYDCPSNPSMTFSMSYHLDRESFGPGSVLSRIDLLNYIKNNINPKLVADYQLVETLFSSASQQSHGTGSGLGAISSPLNPGISGSNPVSFGRVQGAYLRGKELNRSQDKFLRISWYTHTNICQSHTHARHTHTCHSHTW
jgi:hypothetical protein